MNFKQTSDDIEQKRLVDYNSRLQRKTLQLSRKAEGLNPELSDL